MNWKQIENEYLTIDNFNDDDILLNIKDIIKNLKEPEKLIFIKYLELGSYAGVAKEYKVTKPTAKKYIMIVKNKIINELHNRHNNNSSNN